MTNKNPLPSKKIIHLSKKEQILTGAAQIFTQFGYARSSMSAIAKQAKISKGTLYNYFNDKAALFSAFIEQACHDKLHTVLSPLKQDAPLKETLITMGHSFIQLFSQEDCVRLYRLIIPEALNFPQIGQSFWKNGPQIAIQTLSEWITKQNQKGSLKAQDPVFAAEQFLTLCQTSIAQRLRFNMPVHNVKKTEEKIIQGAVKMFLATYERF